MKKKFAMGTARIAVGVVLATSVICGIGRLAAPRTTFAHCDTMDGPVIAEAKAALETGNVTPTLKWVKQEHEKEVREAFKMALAARAAAPEARAVADTYFFETLVRFHRAGEGEPYTGLKPAGQVEPPVEAADKAIADGSVDELAREIGLAAESGVRQRFEQAVAAKTHKDDSVEAGREYVKAYVAFVHYVEALHNTITTSGPHPAHGHNE